MNNRERFFGRKTRKLRLIKLLHVEESFVVRILILMSMLIAFSGASLAETEETERLAKITEEYAKCADVVLGNFPSGQQSQQVIKAFFKAMLSNVEKMVALERQSENDSARFFLDIMGKDVFTGFLLKGFSELDEHYKASKQQLNAKFNHDWRLVNQQLWAKQGCNAIYVSLPK